MSKQRLLERLQTLSDIVDEKYDLISVRNARQLEELLEAMFVAVCRRKP